MPEHHAAVRTLRRRAHGLTIAAFGAPLAMLIAASSAAQTTDELERRRLRLDIERLERESGLQADILRWLPAASVVIAGIVALYGIWRYFDERRQANELRTEEGVAHNLERLQEPPSDGANFNARVVVALRNLNALAPAGAEGAVSRHRAEVTEAVTTLVRDDFKAFHTTDEARFPRICVDHWPELSELIAGDPELCFLLLERYLAALRDFPPRAPAFMRSVERHDGRYTSTAPPLPTEDAQRFAAVVAGFERFVRLAPEGPQRTAAIAAFTETAGALGRQLFPSGATSAP